MSASIKLKWRDNSNNETGFELERCTGQNCTTFTKIADLAANATTYTDTDLQYDTIYRYRIRAINLKGKSRYSDVLSVNTGSAPVVVPPPVITPSAPSGVSATGADKKITIRWTLVAGETYSIKKSATHNGPYTTLITGLDVGSYDDVVDNSVTAFYVVVATLNGVDSANSSEVTATSNAGAVIPPPVVAPSVPTGLIATAGDGNIQLNWDTELAATNFIVKYALVHGGPYTTLATVLSNSYLATNLTNGTAYYFVVEASNSGGTSANSSEASATPAAPTGTLFVCNTATEFQSALNAAVGGDTIQLRAGNSFLGPFTLPAHSGASYVTITTTGALPPIHDVIPLCHQIGPTFDAEKAKKAAGKATMLTNFANANMPKVYTNLTSSAIDAVENADYYKFIGVEFHTTWTALDVPTFAIITFGLKAVTQANINVLADLPLHIYFDRCYFHGNPNGGVRRAILANCGDFTLINSYIGEIHELGNDNQGIMCYNGPGPFHIENNFLEVACENILFGGAGAPTPNLIPSDIVQTRNYFTKDWTWWSNAASVGEVFAGKAWAVKNLTECKNAQRVKIYNNVIENCWAMNQNGGLILFQSLDDSHGTAPWSVVKDIEVWGNLVRNGGHAVSIGGRITDASMGSNVNFHDNLCYNILQIFSDGQVGVNGISSGSNTPPPTVAFDGVTINHNTYHNLVGYLANINSFGDKLTNLVITNNFCKAPGDPVDPGSWYDSGILGDSTGGWLATLNAYAGVSWIVTKNILGTFANQPTMPAGNVKLTPAEWDAIFANINTHDYSLPSGSPYKAFGTDGKDIGCDLTLIPGL